ncbi:MAG: protein translocase subunit SecF [Chloroflexi bacterium]|nr:protein translocase subunit SecF [Chloroflexota bacterium]MQG05824.1 protein translocase subunit SecF [SAR202 cluster bacterium]
MVDFVNKRIWFFSLSLILISIGVIFLIISPGLKPGIDFTGGSTISIKFNNDTSQEDIRSELSQIGHPNSVIQMMEKNTYFIRTKQLNDKTDIISDTNILLNPEKVSVLSFDTVSAVIALETIRNAFIAIIAASIGIFLYIWWAFRNVPSPSRYGIAAIIALLHDTIIVIGLFAMLGKLFGVEVNTMFLIALLTVIGYSVNDTIVIFDRIRENIATYPNYSLSDVANLSVAESFGRSLNTSFTLIFAILALLLFGGPTIKNFLWVLLAGVIVGTYSSMGIATNLLITWETKKFR